MSLTLRARDVPPDPALPSNNNDDDQKQQMLGGKDSSKNYSIGAGKKKVTMMDTWSKVRKNLESRPDVKWSLLLAQMDRAARGGKVRAD